MIHFPTWSLPAHAYTLLLGLLLLLLAGKPPHAQAQQADIIELKKNLFAAASDTQRLSVLLELGYVYHYDNPPKSKYYYQEATNLAINLKDTTAYIRSRLGIAEAQLNLKKPAQALENLNKLLELTENKFQTYHSPVLGLIARVYREEHTYDKAIHYYEKKARWEQKKGMKEKLAYTFSQIGDMHRELEDYAMAHNYYQKELQLNLEAGNDLYASYSLQNISECYLFQENYNQALSYAKRALKIKKELNNTGGIAYTLNHFGMIYIAQSQYDKALKTFTESLRYCNNIKRPAAYKIRRKALKGKAKSLSLLGNFDLALRVYDTLLELSRAREDLRGELTALSHQAQTYLNKGQNHQAIETAQAAETLAKRTHNDYRLREISEILSIAWTRLNKYDKALDYYKTSAKLNMEEKEEQHRREIKRLEGLQKIALERKITQFQEEQEMAASEQVKRQLQTNRLSIIVLTCLAVLFLLLLVLYWNKLVHLPATVGYLFTFMAFMFFYSYINTLLSPYIEPEGPLRFWYRVGFRTLLALLLVSLQYLYLDTRPGNGLTKRES